MKKTVGVIFGGRTTEHDVSIITAHIPIIQALEASGQFDPWPIYITKSGLWYCDQAMNKLEFFKNPDYPAVLAKQKPVQLSLGDGLTLSWPGLRSKSLKLDVVFPSMHGTYGEDGTLMGLLRLAGVPYVGCDLESSAIAMDKVLTKQVTEPLGIPSVPYVWFTASDWPTQRADILARITKRLQYPLFVKPVHLGSSIAITKVGSPKELENAIEVALHYDDKVIVEQSVEDLIEVTLPIMGNDELTLALVEQPVAKFFDFEEKYLKGGGKKSSGANSEYSHLPAQISDKLTARVNELGRAAYRSIGASGTARLDFLIDSKTNQVYLNEINTLPGSLYHHNWQAAGISGVDLVTKLVALAEERFRDTEAKTYTFNSEILKVVGGPKLG